VTSGYRAPSSSKISSTGVSQNRERKLLIVGFLFLTAFIIHAFWKIADPPDAEDGADGG
jgi:hypothetical protein